MSSAASLSKTSKNGEVLFFLQKELGKSTLNVVDQRTFFQRVHHISLACIRMLKEQFNRLSMLIFTSPHEELFIATKENLETKKQAYDLKTLPWHQKRETESKGLYLFIHGLRGPTQCWNPYLSKVVEDSPGFDCLAPKVLLGGNSSLEKTAEPFLELVEDYAKENPGKPIVIVGTSNGARIAMYVENKLSIDLAKDRKLTFVSLAGIHNGTKLVTLAAKCRLLFTANLHPEVVEDYSYESKTSKDRLEEWRNRQMVWRSNQINVAHYFGAAAEDEQVRPLSSSLPHADCANSTYKIFPGDNHLSIVPSVCNEVMEWINFRHR